MNDSSMVAAVADVTEVCEEPHPRFLNSNYSSSAARGTTAWYGLDGGNSFDFV